MPCPLPVRRLHVLQVGPVPSARPETDERGSCLADRPKPAPVADLSDTKNEIPAFTALIGAQESRLAGLPDSERDYLAEASAVLRRLRTAIPTAIEKPFIPVGSLRIRQGRNEDDA